MPASIPLVEPAPQQHRNPYLWFGIANFIALIFGGAIYLFFLRARFLDGLFGAFGDFLFDHAGLAVFAAVSPVFAGLLVGMGYAKRGKARRAAEARAAMLAAEAALRPTLATETPGGSPGGSPIESKKAQGPAA